MSSFQTERALAASAPVQIGSLAQVPPGELRVEGLPSEWQSRFAVIFNPASQSATVLTTTGALGSAAMFDMRRRLHDQGILALEFRNASDEIVKLLHERRRNNSQLAAEDGDDTATERFAWQLVDEGVRRGASDIHIETRSDHAALYFRINGLRVLFSNISFESARALGVVLYSVHADATSKDVTWDPQQVMDGAIEHRSDDGRPVQLRFSSAPIFPSGNFHIVIRILILESNDVGLVELGYTEEQLRMLESMTSDLSGLVILCGPTNSGKSTTMQALMGRIHAERGEAIKMITVEDPVEYIIPGACQIGVARRRRTSLDERTGNAFTTFLRGTLRQDPDVVMVGEIRDIDSASVVKDLVLAGRKLLTTLHTYSALWAFVRLRELGVPMELLTMPGFISGIVYQRLVPVLCRHCSRPLGDGLGLADDLVARARSVCRTAAHTVRVRGEGCAQCNGSGISGRTVCAEFVVPDRQLLALVAAQRFLDAEQYWHRQARLAVDGLGVTALAHGIHKMRQGLLDPRDLESSIGRIDTLADVPQSERQP